MDIKKEIIKRFTFIYWTFLAAIILIFFTILYLRVFKHDEYTKKQLNTCKRKIEAPSGDILDINGRLLATSHTMYTIRMDPLTEYLRKKDTFNKYIDTLCIGLADILKEKSAEEYKDIIVSARNNANRNVLIVENINFLTYQKIKKLPLYKKGRNKGGIKVSTNQKIKLTHGNLGRRIIGFENTKGQFFGILDHMSSELSGIEGIEIAQNLGQNHFSTIKIIKTPSKGLDVISTIDINMQDIVDKALRKQLKELKAHSGVVILMHVETGQIRALANLKINSDSNYYGEIKNMALVSLYEPGSVMKVPSVMIAFEKNPNLRPSTFFNTGNGVWKITDAFKVTDYKKGGFGVIDVQTIIEKSSNIGTAKIITSNFKNNPQDFINRLGNYYFTKPLNLEIDNPPVPQFSSPNTHWSKVSLHQISYGYEISVTPMHIITFYNAIANNGKMVKPIFVKAIQDIGKPLKEYEPVVLNSSICTPKNLMYFRNMLKGVIERGTGKDYVKSDLVDIAGKSGTAQINIDGEYRLGRVNATFVGYFPAEKPKYTCLVWINRPQKHKSGSHAAGVVLKEIAEEIYKFDYDLHNNKEFVVNHIKPVNSTPYLTKGFSGFAKRILNILNIKYSDNKFSWVSPKPQNNEFILQPMYVKKDVMPNLIGMNARDAVFLLEKYKLNIEINGAGQVIKQSIEPGSRVSENQKIILTFG